MTRALRRAPLWLSPPLLLLAVYWPGLQAWFQADDFAWLSLWRQVSDWKSLLHVLFQPMAQGTIRPWSERGFFLVFHHWFGDDALPWRVFVFCNAIVCLLLLAGIAYRITRVAAGNSVTRALAAWLAPIVWIVSAGLPVPMTWTADYNQIQCASFLLGCFYARLRGKWLLEAALFVLGFGALEINVVYPALALAWIGMTGEREHRKRDLARVAILFLLSVLYFFLHAHWAPPVHSGPYAMHFDSSLFSTAERYWRWAVLAPQWSFSLVWQRVTAALLVGAFSLALGYAACRERRATLFGLAWFAITLAPLLPLRDHVTEYYLTIPAAGLALAIAGGAAYLFAVSTKLLPRASIAVTLLVFLALNAAAAHEATGWWTGRSLRVRTLVLGTVTARERNPGKAILLDGLSDELFETAIAHSPFNALDVADVYLSPETFDLLRTKEDSADLARYVLPPGPTLRALGSDGLVVYRVHDRKLQNVTRTYEQSARAHLENKIPERVDVGNPLMAYLLGSEWYPLEGGYRWMPQQATVRLGAPLGGRFRLVLTGYCPEAFVRSGPLQVQVAIDEEWLPPTEIDKPETPFVRTFDVPASSARRESALVRIRVSRTTHSAGDTRNLGLAFGIFEFRP